ncbi:hypothetical protein ABPG72_017210 [Tetrahymena utriculariae]
MSNQINKIQSKLNFIKNRKKLIENEEQNFQEDHQENKKLKEEYRFNQKMYDWLQITNMNKIGDNELMSCKYCLDYQQYLKESKISDSFSNIFTEGSLRYKQKALGEHNTSEKHKQASQYFSTQKQNLRMYFKYKFEIILG